METVTTLTSAELDRVRFAKGVLAPNGQLYYPSAKKEVSEEQIKKAIKIGIKRNVSKLNCVLIKMFSNSFYLLFMLVACE